MGKWPLDDLIFTGHAVHQMFARQISVTIVRHVIEHGETIAEYPDDQPYPSRLLFALADIRPIHVVLGYDKDKRIGYVITAYVPDPLIWQSDFKHRRSP